MDDEEFKRRIRALPKDKRKVYEDKLADIRNEAYEKSEEVLQRMKEPGKTYGLDGDRRIMEATKKVTDEMVDKVLQLKEEIIEDLLKQDEV